MKMQQSRWVKGEDLNIHSNLFGGRMLAWIDEDSSMCAHDCLSSSRLTTIAMDRVSFKIPVKLGDRLNFYYNVIYIGNTSIMVSVNVERVLDKTSVFEACVTLCCVNDNGRPTKIYPHLKPEIQEKISIISDTPEWRWAEHIKNKKNFVDIKTGKII